MQQYTNEPPEDLNAFIQQLKFYVAQSYVKGDKDQITTLLQGVSVDIIKTGNWGKVYGHAEAKATFFIRPDHLKLVTPSLRENLRDIVYKILQSFKCGLEIIEIDFARIIQILQ